ncbi:MAG: DUF4838 domain-containing protein [Candidatus Brocadiia bacterium]
MDIHVKTCEPVVAYAAAELGRCLGVMTDGEASGSVTLGLFADCGVDEPSLPDPGLDDAIHVRFDGETGCIAGSNPRSVLIGVYRLLRELGCRWVRPGPTGELIPRRSLDGASVSLDETASYRHRVVCIEGAVSLSNVLDTVDWLPKVGFNGFYMQFQDGYTFFDRWYSHRGSPRRERKEPIERGMAREFTEVVEEEIARRGLLYHAVGHGWHAEAYGVPGIGWMEMHDLPDEFLEKTALVAGRRTVRWSKPMLTALCYSDPDVQERMVNYIADYAEAHPNVDYLHVWLDDSYNNKCECERCRQKRTFDFYVQILNALDEELIRRDVDTRLVFLAYDDLLMPPLEEWFRGSARFTFMYANGREDYRRSLAPVGEEAEPVSFELNRLPRGELKSVQRVAARLQDWMDRIECDSFIFEYYGGAESIERARVVWQDVRNLRLFGLNGLVNCQALRVYFPTGLGMVTLGRTLWDAELEFDAIASDYFRAAFGDDGEACRGFLAEAEQLVDEVNRLLDAEDDATAAILEFEGLLEDFEAVLARNEPGGEDACRATSWRLMRLYAYITREFAAYARIRNEGDPAAMASIGHPLREYLQSVEDEYQPFLEPRRVVRRFFR